MSNVLPEGWVKTNLSDILVINYGKGLTKKNRDPKGHVYVYGSSGIVGKHSQSLIKEKCIIIGRKGTVGSVFYTTGPSWPIDTVYYSIPSNEIYSKYLLYNLDSQNLKKLDKSTAIPSIRRDDLYEVSVNIPPYNEQVRIVSKIEELFSRLDQGTKTLQETLSQLEKYRQSILFSAFHGVLTEKWRKRSDSILCEYPLEPPTDEYWNLPDTWRWKKFYQIAKINPKLPYEITDDQLVSFIPMANVEEETGDIDLSEERRYGEVKNGYKRFINDDIIFAKITPCMENGKIAIPRNLKNNIGTGSTEFHVIRMKSSAYLNKFYYYYILQKWFRTIAEMHFTGSVGHRRVPTDFMKNVFVPVTNLDEQEKIVEIIESNFSIIEKNKREIIECMNKCNLLKQSILQKAFSGELVPQTPEDEPASVLLERIKSEKAIQSRGRKK